MEETLNELLEREAESLTQAARYEHNEARQGLSYRSGQILPLHQATLHCICHGSRVCLSRLPSPSDIVNISLHFFLKDIKTYAISS